MEKLNRKCPNCKSEFYKLRGDITFGQGDVGHECFVVCSNCGNEGPKAWDWGWPTNATFRKALDLFQDLKVEETQATDVTKVLFKITNIETLRDGGTTELQTSNSVGSIYIKTGLPLPTNKFHTGYPCRDENEITDPLFLEYLEEQMDKYISKMDKGVAHKKNLFIKVFQKDLASDGWNGKGKIPNKDFASQTKNFVRGAESSRAIQIKESILKDFQENCIPESYIEVKEFERIVPSLMAVLNPDHEFHTKENAQKAMAIWQKYFTKAIPSYMFEEYKKAE
jgi:hypothetical protein